MRALIRLVMFGSALFCGGVIVIKIMYDVSWGEAVEIADQFIEDLLKLINGSTKVIGVIGDPVEHTASPTMHNAAIQDLGIDYVYVAFRVRGDELSKAIEGMRALGMVV